MIIDCTETVLATDIYWTYARRPYIQKPEVSEGSRRGEDTGAKGFVRYAYRNHIACID